MNHQSKTTFVVLAVAIVAVFIASSCLYKQLLVTTEAEAKKRKLAEEPRRQQGSNTDI
jgi:hypothetical protein